MNTVSIRGVTLKIGETTILEKVNAELSGSGNSVLFGPNGAGKSSLLKAMTGMILPQKGDVIINGASIRNDREEALGYIGAHIEPGSFYPQLTGREVLNFTEKIRCGKSGGCELGANALIERLHMAEYADRKVGTYSTGMRRNLAVATAAMCAPPVVILDEPTDGLDPASTMRMNGLMEFLHKEKQCLLITTSHDIEGAELISTRKLILMDGTIVFDSEEKGDRLTVRFEVSNPGRPGFPLFNDFEVEREGSSMVVRNISRSQVGHVLREVANSCEISSVAFESEFRQFYESFLTRVK